VTPGDVATADTRRRAVTTITARAEHHLVNDLGHIGRRLGDHNFLRGTEFSGAGIRLSFVRESAGRWTGRSRAIETSKPGCAVSGRVQGTLPRSRAGAGAFSRWTPASGRIGLLKRVFGWRRAAERDALRFCAVFRRVAAVVPAESAREAAPALVAGAQGDLVDRQRVGRE
jgi:hypothetical protein